MKTVEELFRENKAYGLAYEYGYNVEVVSLSFALELSKRYARKVAEQALKDAAENKQLEACTMYDWQNIADLNILKQSILNTEIKTP